MKRKVLYTGIAALFAASSTWAVPVLQIGAPAPAGSGEGIYADYQSSTSNPDEKETAITSGDKLYVGGVYDPNTLFLGGQFLGNGTYPVGLDWSQLDRPTAFDGHGAILVVSVPDGSLASALSSLQINNQFAFYSNADNSYFVNNHAPLGSSPSTISDFLFFDIGSFGNTGNVSDFVTESGSATGEIKELTLSGFGTLAWIHFDVMALETDSQGQTSVKTSADGNPGSHDVTWKDGPPSQEIPEPGTLALLGLGLLGFGASRRYKKKK
jgi:hypothetical protein